MDFEKLFDKINLWDIGRESFYTIDKRRERESFCDALSESFEVYKKGDAAFGEYIAEFAEREELPVEVLNLYIYIRMSEKTLEEYRRRKIDEDIFYETMKDFGVDSRYYYEKAGVYGISQSPHRPWIRLHLGNGLYRLGRLQFELIKSGYDVEVDGYRVSKGSLCVTTHVPRYEKLSEEECEASYARAREFFKKYYGMERCVFFCDSWLLHPWISECLKENSRIVRFQSKYKLLDVYQSPDTVVNYVFGKKEDNPQDYPEDTGLRRIAKERIIKGLPLGTAVGVRL